MGNFWIVPLLHSVSDIFGPRDDEGTRGWSKLCNEEGAS